MTSPQIRRSRRKLGFETIGGHLGHPVSLAIRHATLDRYWVRPVKATGGLAPAVPLPLLPGQSIPPVYNWPVRIGQDHTGQAVILGVDSDAQHALGLPALATNPLDPAARYTPKELLTELLCVPDARTGYVRVYPGKVVFGDQAVDFAGDALEILAAYGPTAGNHRYVGIFLTPVGALEAQASTAQANTSALDVTDVQECLDAATAGSLLIRTFKVDGDDTELRGSIEESPDWRNLWAPIAQGILAYGEMGGFQISETVTVSVVNTWYELTAGLSGGEQLLCTFQNAHEIEVGVTGKYEVNWSMSLTATGAGLELMGCVGVNGTEVEKTANHDTVSNANAFVTVAGSGILDLAAGDVVSMFVLNESGTQDITIEHVTCTLQCFRPVQTGLIADAADVTYTPAVLADWAGSADPGNQDDANDQLASRVTTIEALNGREVLSGNRTYYVNGTLGSDSNDGLSSGAGAFATWQHACDVVGSIDVAIYTVTINIAAGTYNEDVVLPKVVGSGDCILVGDEGTPSNVVLNSTTFGVKGLGCGTNWNLRGFKLTGASTGGIFIQDGTVRFQTLDFGAMTLYHIFAGFKGAIAATGSYTISGSAAIHWAAYDNGSIVVQAKTVTLSGTPAFSSYFAIASRGGTIPCNANTFSGSATGTRYLVEKVAIIDTVGGGATYLPGNAAGSTATNGIYA